LRGWRWPLRFLEELNDAFVVPLTLAACSKSFAFRGGAVLSFGIARIEATEGRLPRMQSWGGQVGSWGVILTVSVMVYGEAALAVTCRHPPLLRVRRTLVPSDTLFERADRAVAETRRLIAWARATRLNIGQTQTAWSRSR